MNDIKTGDRLAHYRILESLGAGGMGAVYQAYDEKLDRVVALKLLPLDAVRNEDRRRRFLQEARAASALNHPHILTVYEIGEDQGRHYIAMEYIQGETLRQRLSSGELCVVDVLDLAIQIADGLAKAHEHGIVHRDLKPDNLMISRDGYVKILDFGLAKLVDRRGVHSTDSAQKTMLQVKTQAGMLMGTINYMSPEQLLGKKVDPRSDIFSFGIVLYEMVTRQRPFARDNDIDTMHAILHEQPKPLGRIDSRLPDQLQQILTKALAKQCRQRYQTIKELAKDLRVLKQAIELGPSEPAHLATLTQPRTRLVLKPVTADGWRAATIDYEKELNQSQYQAVTTTEGPLLIVAGAGTGKTRTLVYRVARLIQLGVQPESVLLLTFTRRAAASMLARAAALADERCQRVSGGTFHSIAHATLRRYPDMVGIARTFTVLDQSDAEDLVDLVRRQNRLKSTDRHFPRKRTIAALFSMAINKLISIEEALQQHYPQFLSEHELLQHLFEAFEAFKRERHLLTYDDLLVRLRDALQTNHHLCRLLSDQYRYIMVDEYQDTNKVQAQIVRLMAMTHDNVAVVGDESQAIYSFRGASFKNMLEFSELFPDTKIVKLEENFRSTQPILDVANAIIAHAKEGYAKRLYSGLALGPAPLLVSTSDEHQQSQFVAQRIEELHQQGVLLEDMAVLFRARSHSFDLEIELARQKIPFRKFGGIKLVESAHIRDVLAFLRIVVNPADSIAWSRVLKLLEHVGDVTVEHILMYLGLGDKELDTEKTKDHLFKKLGRFPAKAASQNQIIRLSRLLRTINKRTLPRNQLPDVNRFYRPILKAKYDDYPRRECDLEHLLTIAKRYRTTTDLLSDIALDPNEVELGQTASRSGFVTLSTVHAAKGLEWDAVFVIWMMDGWFPSSRTHDDVEDLEEERRLLYVATSRAKRHLYFTCPMTTRTGWWSSGLSTVSRFLEPIPETILPRATLASH